MMKLICFPYAGGSAAVFSKWDAMLNADIGLRAVELPGRGKRFGEPGISDFGQAIDDIYSQVVNDIGKYEYAFFGHSLGAKIAFSLSLIVRDKGLRPPRHIFFSGRGAPNVPYGARKEYGKMSDAEFRDEVFNLGGTPKEFFDFPELLDVFFPILRNDFNLSEGEEEQAAKSFKPLPWDITVFLGKDEPLTAEQVVGWKEVTRGNCAVHYFNGGHFFLNDETENVIARINQVLVPQQLVR